MNKRIFAAIDISAEARSKVADYMENLRNEFRHLRVGWERSEKLHLTLKFYGDTNENQLENLNRALEKLAKQVSIFKLQILETGIFPSRHNPRILWLGIRDEQKCLSKINSLLEEESEKIGFVKEKRSFKPHLTIARAREPHKASELAARHLQNHFETSEFEVSELVIYESRLQKNGSIYSVIARYELAK